ncbi:MAG: ABC transporter ATP-binding protein [Ilumatobacter sp.]|nr:MAG: ABC transporter ATP-binding protein [Ilumatobacter sp.]
MWLTIALTVTGSFLLGAQLLVGRELVDFLVDGTDRTAASLVPWLVLLGALLVGTALVNAATAELRILLNELVHKRAMDQLLEVTTAAELEAFEDATFHDRIQLAREHADTYAWQVVWGLVTFMTTLFAAVAVIAVLLTVAPLLVPVALVAYIPIAVVNVRNTRALYLLHYGLAELDRDRAYHERLLTGRLEAKEVRAFGLAARLRARHDELFEQRVHNTRRVVKRRTVLALIGSSITALILVTALAVVMLLALDERISVGDAAVAVVALQQLASRLRSSGDAMTSMVEGVTFLRDFESFRSLLPPGTVESSVESGAVESGAVESGGVEVVPGAVDPVPAQPSRIVLDHVSYRYPAGDTPVLHGVNVAIRRGEVLAVVGPNGAGKSTLAKVLCGLLPPTSGAIRWDDVDVARHDPAAVRARVAAVFQDFTRFEHTAREAIGFGDVDRLDDIDGVHSAAQRAGADTFLTALPNGYDTRLSTAFSGGTELSVGQWQRVAIARAFFRDAPLVVMDEPAASLDPRAERDLFDRLHDLGRDRMVVFISHRFATVRRADQIIVLLEGQVAEQGNHDELMALGGVYAELYSLQAEQFG